ncbi:hypothetical protein vseg_001909 [Gypsophila vaccaria]
MSSLELQSTTFVPSLEITRQDTPHLSQMCPDLSAWLGLDTNSPGFSNNPRETNDSLSRDYFILDYSSSYYSSLNGAPNFELMSSYQNNEPLLDQCNGFNSYPLGNYDQYGNNSFGISHYQMCDKVDNVGNNFCSTYSSSDSSNIYDAVTQHQAWFEQGYQSRHTIPSCESENNSTNNNKVGRYSLEERRDCILRYLKKKHLRNYRKTIKYACRKTLADRRVRIRGRFAKNSDEEMHSSQDGDTTRTYFDYTKNEEYSDQDYWLHEAIESLM